jgi:serine/threonine protein kinase
MHTIDPARIGRPLGDEHPQQLDRYELLRVLGVGGMGTVFLAKQTNLDRFVAVKLLGGARGVSKMMVALHSQCDFARSTLKPVYRLTLRWGGVLSEWVRNT